MCVPPCYVKRIKEKYKENLKICTVIGFPLGYNPTEVKELETVCALRDGADEIDMVINICELKNGNFDYVEDEIARLRKLTKDKMLKVIVETCYLTEEEKIRLCNIVSKVKADFIKTSTGFGSGGATIKDVKLFKEHISKDVQIKASGGIKTKEDMIAYLNEGCQRLGTSSASVLAN